jgi:hypothetical protein
MATIEGVERVEQVVGRWFPSDLAIIEGLELKSDPNAGVSILVIQALFQRRADHWPDFNKEMFRVIIAFEDLGGLHLKDFGGAVQIMGFDIHFVGDRGLEGINYEIEDYEDGRIRFHCRRIRIQSAELAD